MRFFRTLTLNLAYPDIINADIIMPTADIISVTARKIMLIIINAGCFAFSGINLYINNVSGRNKNINVSEVNRQHHSFPPKFSSRNSISSAFVIMVFKTSTRDLADKSSGSPRLFCNSRLNSLLPAHPESPSSKRSV